MFWTLSARTKTRGQVIVELALIFPFFVLIVLGGLIDFGFAFYNLLTLQQIAAEAAQYCAEGNENNGLSDSEVRDFIFQKKPVWWKGNFLILPIKDIKTSDGLATIKRVGLVYESPIYTPFYQIMFQSTVNKSSIQLVAFSAFQVPRHIY